MSAPSETALASTDAPPEAENLISIARIARPQGRHGEVVADLLTDFPERFAKLKSARVKLSNGQLTLRELEKSWLHKGRVVLKFVGCDSIEQAESLRDAQVMISRAQLVELPTGSYYDFDLVDCQVTTKDGQEVGRVTEVQSYGAAPLLVVQDGAREYLIPLALSICEEIDTTHKRIIINPPEGLLDL
jgi:16S rRNA processing protein RimM